MNQEPNPASPFSALTYQEQQDRWLEWRSRQLDYRDANALPPEKETSPSPLPVPRIQQAAPSHHRELDLVLSRHDQALKHLGAFQATYTNGSSQ